MSSINIINQLNMEDQDRLKSYKEDYLNTNEPEVNESPVNRLSAIIFETTNRQNHLCSEPTGNINIPEFNPISNGRSGRIVIPSMEELEAKVKGGLYNPISKQQVSISQSSNNEVNISTHNQPLQEAHPMDSRAELSREKFYSPNKQLCPIVIETTQRDIEEIQIPFNEIQDLRKSEYEIRTMPFVEKHQNKKKTQNYTILLNESKAIKNTGKTDHANTNKENIKNIHNKNLQRKQTKKPGKGYKKRAKSIVKEGLSKTNSLKLWAIAKKHAKRCMELAADLRKEGLLA